MTQINRQHVKDTFAMYTSHYNIQDPKIKLKIDHTYRVAGISQRIAQSLGLSKTEVDLAWLIGMLHDVGRFEQLRRFGTFSDSDSIDHAQFGGKLLFDEGLLKEYLPPEETGAEFKEEKDASFLDGKRKTEGKCSESVGNENHVFLYDGSRPESGQNTMSSEDFSKMENKQIDILRKTSVGKGDGQENMPLADLSVQKILYTAIWNHSAYRIEEGLDERTKMFCQIIRDADKIDILKVNHDVPIEEIYNVTTQELYYSQVTPEVMEAFFEKHAVLRSLKKSPVDHIVGHSALVFELVYPVSYQIVKEQGYLDKILKFDSDNPVTREQFKQLRQCMGRYMTEKLG